MPLRKVSKKEYKRRFQPWITVMIHQKIDKNKKLNKYAKCKDTKTKELNTEIKRMKNEITTLTR